MTGRSSRQKGKRGEYILRDLLRKWGFEARRGHAHAGEPDEVHSIPGYHIEMKNVEALNIWAALTQAARDAVALFEKRWTTVTPELRPPADEPILFFKRNNTPVYGVVNADTLLRLLRLESTYD